MDNTIQGLKCCLTKEPEGRCRVCPYAGPACTGRLMADALALLEKQEANEARLRVLEFHEIDELATYWIEDARADSLMPETIMDIHGDSITTIPVVRMVNGFAPVIDKRLDGYGRHWRCWNLRPTDEQRKAVKWDE